MRNYYRWIVVFVIMFFGCFTLSETVASEENRPKIALVLGGGSAKGFVHIGVIKWLEEHRIPIDFVAGTSMGGLIGGCYAMGMEPDEITKIVRQINWERIFTPIPPYDTLNFRRKEDRRKYPLEMQFGWKGKKIGLPSGITSYEIDFLLSRLTLPYSGIKNFTNLPLPYSCTATDLASSKLVIMDRGSLVEAMRSTMSLPGIFAPVRYDGKILVDGGVLNNVPADVGRKMGADIVIAVNVSGSKEQLEKSGSVNNVLMQTITTVIVANSNEAMNTADIIITPNLKEIGSLDWDKVDDFIQMGYIAAEKQGEFLKTFSVDDEDWEKWEKKRQHLRKTKVIVPAVVEIVGTKQSQQDLIMKHLKKHVGVPLDIDLLEQDLRMLIGTGRFESFRYEYNYQNNEPILVIKVIEKPYDQPFIETSILLEADNYRAEHVELNARTRLTWFDLWGENSETRLELGFGTENKLNLEMYKPLSETPFFFDLSYFLEQNNSNLFENGNYITDYKITHNGLLFDFGLYVSDLAEIRLGYAIGHQGSFVKGSKDLLEDTDGAFEWVRLKSNFSLADNPVLPRKGIRWECEAKWYLKTPGAVQSFTTVDSTLFLSFPNKEKDSYFFRFSAGASYGEELPLVQQFKLGGPFRLGVYHFDELHDQNYFLSSAGYVKHIYNLPITKREVYLCVWGELGDVFPDWSDINLEYNISAGLISPTIFGPAYFGASIGEEGNRWFYLGLGKIF